MKLDRIVPTLILALAMAGSAHAQSSDANRIKELEKKLERSLEMIEQLSTKISKLEQASAGTQDAQAKGAAQAAKLELIEKRVSEIGTGLSQSSLTGGLPLHGFADVGLVRSGERNSVARGRKGAMVGGLDLYLTPQFGDHVKTLVEVLIEADRDGETETEIERLQIGYAFSDLATAWLGRFHTPYGYWNTAYHHGAQIQTSILRPRFLEFEDSVGGMLPAHTVGAWLTGKTMASYGMAGYDLFLGNAPQIESVAAGSALSAAYPNGFSPAVNAGTYAGSGKLNPRQGGISTGRASMGFNAWVEPNAVEGLRLGLHGMRADVIDSAASPNRTLLRMTGGYFAYLNEPWEIMGEYYRFRNTDRSGNTGNHSSSAGFVQAGYHLGRWIPFVRAENAHLDQKDNYFGVQYGGRSYRRASVGLRYDLEHRAALKLELASTRLRDLGPGLADRYSEILMQYAVGF